MDFERQNIFEEKLKRSKLNMAFKKRRKELRMQRPNKFSGLNLVRGDQCDRYEFSRCLEVRKVDTGTTKIVQSSSGFDEDPAAKSTK